MYLDNTVQLQKGTVISIHLHLQEFLIVQMEQYRGGKKPELSALCMHFLSLDCYAGRKKGKKSLWCFCCQAYTHLSVLLLKERLNYPALCYLCLPGGSRSWQHHWCPQQTHTGLPYFSFCYCTVPSLWVLQSYDKAVSWDLRLTPQNHVRKDTQSLHNVMINGLSNTREMFPFTWCKSNYPSVRLKVASKDHQNDLGVKIKNKSFPKSTDVLL